MDVYETVKRIHNSADQKKMAIDTIKEFGADNKFLIFKQIVDPYDRAKLSGDKVALDRQVSRRGHLRQEPCPNNADLCALGRQTLKRNQRGEDKRGSIGQPNSATRTLFSEP